MRRTAVALGAGVLVLAGCSSTGSGQSVVPNSGQAPVSEAFRVSQQEIADDVSLVLEGLGQPPGEPPAGLASVTTERIVLYRLIDSYAEANGIEVTRTEAEQGLEELAAANGGQDALREAALGAGIPVEALERTVRTNLLVTGIGAKRASAVASSRPSRVARQDQIWTISELWYASSLTLPACSPCPR